MRGGVLYVNGVAQHERYVTHTEPGADPSYEDFRWQRDYVARTAAAEITRRVGGDLEQPDALGNAFDGIDRLYLLTVGETAQQVALADHFVQRFRAQRLGQRLAGLGGKEIGHGFTV